jgi:hypothetical protein
MAGILNGKSSHVYRNNMDYFHVAIWSPHPTFYPMGTEGSFPGVKLPGHEAYHSPPASAEVKKMWIYTSTSP